MPPLCTRWGIITGLCNTKWQTLLLYAVLRNKIPIAKHEIMLHAVSLNLPVLLTSMTLHPYCVMSASVGLLTRDTPDFILPRFGCHTAQTEIWWTTKCGQKYRIRSNNGEPSTSTNYVHVSWQPVMNLISALLIPLSDSDARVFVCLIKLWNADTFRGVN